MLTLPKIVDRAKEPYAAIKAEVPLGKIGEIGPPLLGEVAGWLGARGIAPASAPFFKYNRIDMAKGFEMEFGFPTGQPVTGDGRVIAGVLPAGRYASLVHWGPYENLYDATAVLIGWAKERGIVWDAAGDRFASRLEIYRTDPTKEPDSSKWETEVTIRIADA